MTKGYCLPDVVQTSKPFIVGSERNIGVFYSLVKHLHNESSARRPLAIIGSGVSAQAQLPSWSKMLESLHETIYKRVSPMAQAMLDKVKAIDDFPWKAEEYRRLSSKDELHDCLMKMFALDTPRELLLQKDLLKLNFSHYLTTNYDNLLEQACTSEHIRAVDWSSDKLRQRFFVGLDNNDPSRFIVHLHGTLGHPETLVLTERDYVNRYIKSEQTNRELFSLFLHHPVVFIGYSLNDPELTNLLRIAKAHRGDGSLKHFAILSYKEKGNDEHTRARLLNGKYGIQPLYYTADNGHENLPKIIGALLEAQEKSLLDIDECIEQYVATKIAGLQNQSDANAKIFESVGSYTDRFRLEAEVEETAYMGWYVIRMRLLSKGFEDLDVTFMLDPETYPNSDDSELRTHASWKSIEHLFENQKAISHRTVTMRNGVAEYSDRAYGAFTVAAVVQDSNGKTHVLKLDLAKLKNAPLGFRVN
ncbi:MAG: SIR2 family protein [Candidatus Obscuribacterales bacterium]